MIMNVIVSALLSSVAALISNLSLQAPKKEHTSHRYVHVSESDLRNLILTIGALYS